MLSSDWDYNIILKMSIEFVKETDMNDWLIGIEWNECNEQDGTIYDMTEDCYLCNKWAYLNHNACKLKQLDSINYVPKLYNLIVKLFKKAKSYSDTNFNKEKSKSLSKSFSEIQEKLNLIGQKLSKSLSKYLFI